MKKSIRTITGIEEVTIEEALAKYQNMAYKFAHTCVNQLETFTNDCNDLDDYFQIGNCEIANCYEKYDINNGGCFSTYLTKCLNNRLKHIKRDLLSQKRKNKPYVYLDESTENGQMSEIISNNKEYSFVEEYSAHNEYDEERLEEFLAKHLNKDEIKMFIINIRKKVCDTECLDCLLAEIGEVPTKKADLADELSISRPTLNNRIEKTMDKIKGLTKEYLEIRGR